VSKTAVRCRGLAKSFAEVQAVDNLNLSLRESQFLALLGPSGCGKTTTLRLVAGFESPDSGQVEIGSQPVSGPGVWVPPEQRSIGMVFQEYALFPHMNVFDNVAYGIQKGVDREKRVSEVVDLVGLAEVQERMPYELSGLLDEPFSNLDAGLRSQVRTEVRQILREAQATVIFVTHDQAEALSLADEVAVMMAGRIAQTDTPQRLYRRPVDKQVATFLGHANFLPGRALDGRVRCELGLLNTPAAHTGPVEVLVRPEDLHLVPDESGPAEIIDRDYFGHDQLVSVRLSSGTRIQSRLHGSAGDFYPGQRVRVQVQAEVVVYPA
jgi:iron(III) transport system ATP-binding protein